MQFIFHTSALNYSSFTTLICKSRIMQSVNSQGNVQIFEESCKADANSAFACRLFIKQKGCLRIHTDSQKINLYSVYLIYGLMLPPLQLPDAHCLPAGRPAPP